MSKKIKSFKVLLFDINKMDIKYYDVMPYLINCYNEIKNKKERPTTFDEFKEFVKSNSLYMYWARCEYEILISKWPFGSFDVNNKMKDFLKSNPDFDKLDDRFRFDNIVMTDMCKIDAHTQIMMNIDIVTQTLIDNIVKKTTK